MILQKKFTLIALCLMTSLLSYTFFASHWLAETSKVEAAQAEPKKGGILRAGIAGDATTLDPHLSTSATDRHIYYSLYNTLVAIDAKLNIIPELAASWETPDPATYIFKLQKGVKFHDGTDFDAEVVKWNVERMLDPATGSIRRSELGSVQAVEVIDSHTVKFVLKQADAALLATLTDRAGMMVSKAAVEKYRKDFARNPVGTGPFQLVEWTKDDHIRVKRFPDYWRKGYPLLDEVFYRPVPDETVRLTSLRANDLHIIDGVPSQNIAGLKNEKEIQLSQVPSLGYGRIELNLTKPPFDNKALRQAVAYAIDREAILRAVYFGEGAPGQGPIPPNSWAYDAEFKGYGNRANPQKTREKLKEAGYPNGFKFAMDVVNSPQAVKLAQLIQESLKKVGIEAELILLEGGTLINRRASGEFQATLGGWSGRVDPDGNIYSHFLTGGANNWGKYSNPQVDEFLKKARLASDLKERKKLYSEATRIISDDAPVVFYHHPGYTKALNKKVQGYLEIPDGRMRFEKVWLRS